MLIAVNENNLTLLSFRVAVICSASNWVSNDWLLYPLPYPNLNLILLGAKSYLYRRSEVKSRVEYKYLSDGNLIEA